MEPQSQPMTSLPEAYSPVARALHWLTVLFIAVQLPLGFYMVWRGAVTSFDATTNTLYTAHKLTGFLLLWLVVFRLIYRAASKSPPPEPSLTWFHHVAAHLNHLGLYVLLILVPLLGWLGVTYYPALGLFGGMSLPPIPGADVLYNSAAGISSLAGFKVPPPGAEGGAKAELVFLLHFWGAVLLMLAIAVHVAAALYHYLIRGDGVLQRMLPGLRRSGG